MLDVTRYTKLNIGGGGGGMLIFGIFMKLCEQSYLLLH